MSTATAPTAPTPFTFEVNSPIPRKTKLQMLSSLKAFAAQTRRRSFTMAQYQAWPRRIYHPATIANHFGTWWLALRAANLRPCRCHNWSPEDLMNTLETTWRKLGHRPTVSQLPKHAPVSQGPYVRLWGSLKHACERLAQYHKGELTREQLLTPTTPPKPRRRDLLPSLRYQVLNRDRHQCTICGRKSGGNVTPTVKVRHEPSPSRAARRCLGAGPYQ